MRFVRKQGEKELIINRPLTLRMKFTNTIIISGIIVLVLFIVYFLLTCSLRPPIRGIILCLISGCGIFLLAIALRWREEIKVNVSLTIVSMVVTIYLLEIFLQLHPPTPVYLKERVKLAREKGINYDIRVKLQVLEDLRSSGFDAYPVIYPSVILGDRFGVEEHSILPLSGISLKTTVLGNENGKYAIYKSDEHGFNNPPGLYNKEELDVVLLGDSFVHGCFVEQSETISEQLRKEGYKSLNLGFGGDGPLLELATLKEYAETLKPKTVLWFYFEGNDLFDIERDKNKTILREYLDDNFSQSLFHRHKEIDSFLVSFVEKRKPTDPPFMRTPFMRVARLINLRERFSAPSPSSPPTASPPPFYGDVLPVLEKILKKANELVSSYGGKLYFVYLPMVERYIENEENFDSFLSPEAVSTIIHC